MVSEWNCEYINTTIIFFMLFSPASLISISLLKLFNPHAWNYLIKCIFTSRCSSINLTFITATAIGLIRIGINFSKYLNKRTAGRRFSHNSLQSIFVHFDWYVCDFFRLYTLMRLRLLQCWNNKLYTHSTNTQCRYGERIITWMRKHVEEKNCDVMDTYRRGHVIKRRLETKHEEIR